MQRIVIDEPYQFVPPIRKKFWSLAMRPILPWYLRKSWGIHSVECQGLEHLQASVAAGHGIMLTPNHCRPCDPLVLGWLVREMALPLYAMASWHLFKQSRFQTWMIRRMGAFSLYREGTDRQALNTAIDILDRAERPLIIFAEGGITRNNDRLYPLLDGTELIARAAARQRAKRNAGQVVLHPTVVHYAFCGNLEQTLQPVLERIEQRLAWQPQVDLPLRERVEKLGEGLLTSREVEYFGRAQTGSKTERTRALMERVLQPLERQWAGGDHDGTPMTRVKRLRTALVNRLLEKDLTADEREECWRHVADAYLALQLSYYTPPGSSREWNTNQILEMVERFEEDLYDEASIHGPLHVTLAIEEAIQVEPKRSRDGDPMMQQLAETLQRMLDEVSAQQVDCGRTAQKSGTVKGQAA